MRVGSRLKVLFRWNSDSGSMIAFCELNAFFDFGISFGGARQDRLEAGLSELQFFHNPRCTLEVASVDRLLP